MRINNATIVNRLKLILNYGVIIYRDGELTLTSLFVITTVAIYSGVMKYVLGHVLKTNN
ncbi:hypothetical protein [Mesobacillus foraminis]|uniref:hypothetical protein n=1 Tax=Mesobacillus foraminis TaxID=279826 RepID=UPI0013CE7795|nr:hypothetical protein [Mesobacillus foraminis]